MTPAGSSQTGGAVAEDAAPPLFPPLWLTVAVPWGGRDWPVRANFNAAGLVRDLRLVDPPDGSERWTEAATACAGLAEVIGHDTRPLTARDVEVLTEGGLSDGFMRRLVETVARVERACADPVRAAYAAHANRVRRS